MFNCYNCRKDCEEEATNTDGERFYCNKCKKYMPTPNPNIKLIEPVEEVKGTKEVVELLKEHMNEEVLNEYTNNSVYSGYEPYKFFRCNKCESYYEDYSKSSYDNLKEAKACCKYSITPFCVCLHSYRWKTIEDANKCCKIDKDSLELK